MERIFLGDDAPLSKLASQFLIKKYKRNNILDLKNVSIVVSGANVYKSILEKILLETEKENISFIPPKTYTVKSIVNEITKDTSKSLISDFQSFLFFLQALKNKKEIVEEIFLKKDYQREGISYYISLAQKILNLYSQIGRVNISFSDVAKIGTEYEEFDDTNRWQVLNEIYEEYKNLLSQNNLIDVFLQRQNFLNQHSDNEVEFKNNNGTESEIIFINTPDLSPIFCDIIKKIKSKISFLIFSKEDKKELFTEYATLNVKKWLKSNVKIDDKNIFVAKDPKHAGNIVANKIVELSKDYSAKDIIIGTTNDAIISTLRSECKKRNIKTSSVREKKITSSTLYLLISSLKNYINEPTFFNFKKFVCNEDILKFLFREDNSLSREEIMSSFDDYEETHLPYHLTKILNVTSEDEVIKKIFELLKGFFIYKNKKESLKFFADVISNIIIKIYGDCEISLEDDAQKIDIQIYEAYKNALIEMSEVSDSNVEILFSFSDALTFLNMMCEGKALNPKTTLETIDMQGWLEIQNDDSDVLILVGLSEGEWPETIMQDEFLPNKIRTVLGIDDNDKRFARDVFVLTTALSSKKEVFFIPIKYNLDLSPNLLSKLFFLDSNEVKARRILEFYDKPLSEFQDDFIGKQDDIRFYKKPNMETYEKYTISASEIREYFISPYMYYLKYVLKLKTIETGFKELDELMYGNIVHEVLSAFGKSKVAISQDENEIKDNLFSMLDDYVKTNFGSEYLPTINVQLEKIRDILSYFSSWQAKRAGEGWKIFSVEEPFKNASLRVTSKLGENDVMIRGRFDRIDYNEEENLYEIIDYKTGVKGKFFSDIYTPKKGWQDWQLPFYIYSLMQTVPFDNIQASYLNLSLKNNPQKYKSEIDISEDELNEALDRAREIIVKIQNAEFEEINKTLYVDDELLELC